jgi:hypothetical protein
MTPSGARDAILDSGISISSQTKKLLRENFVPVTALLCLRKYFGKASFLPCLPLARGVEIAISIFRSGLSGSEIPRRAEKRYRRGTVKLRR